jgi:hypothetical protein
VGDGEDRKEFRIKIGDVETPPLYNKEVKFDNDQDNNSGRMT